MSGKLLVYVYANGKISEGPQGVTFECAKPKVTRIDQNITLQVLKDLIHTKLKLLTNQVVSELIYRFPISSNPLMFNALQLDDDDDVQAMLDCHSKHSNLSSMEVYVKIDTVGFNLDEQDQGRVDCDASTFVSPNPVNTQMSLANETLASSVPEEVCVCEQELGVASSPCRRYTADLNSTAEPISFIAPIDPSSQAPRDILADIIEEEYFQAHSGNEAGDSNTESEGDVAGNQDAIHGDVERIEGEGGVVEPTTKAPNSYYVPSSSFLSHINLQAMSSSEIPGLVKPGSWNENEELYPGLLFATRESLSKALKLYSIKRKQTFMVIKSASKYLDVRCRNYGSNCNWRVRACLRKKLNLWQIMKYGGPHTCVSLSESRDHKKLDSDIIASCIASIVNEKPDVSIAQIIKMMKDRFSYTVSYKKAWSAKQKAIAKEYDDWEGSYSQLPRWMAAVQFYMPGTVVEFLNREYEKDGKIDKQKEFFHRVFWAFKPCVDALHYLKPMIQIDALPLYGKYRGTLFTASSQDGDQSIVPVAFAIVEGETVEAWSWFLGLLRQHVVKKRQGVCLISDRHPAILDSIRNHLQWQPPYAYHVFCIRHLASNFNKMFKNEGLKSLFISMGYQYQRQVVDEKMKEMRSLNMEAANWIDEVPKQQWCRAYDNGHRYGHMTTNLAECVNGVLKGIRCLPITSLVKATMYRLTSYFVDRVKQISSQIEDGKMFCETLNKALNINQERASSSIVRIFDKNATLFEIEEPFDPQCHQFGRICKVNLRDQHCDCGEFQTHKYPCSHVIAACAYVSHDYHVYVNPVYSLDTILNVYRSEFQPIGGEHHWPIVAGPTLVPNPSVLRLKGRPRSNPMKNEMDWKESRQSTSCSLCSGIGHNCKTCPSRKNNQNVIEWQLD